ncbi:MAG: hypothetical protein L0G06_01650, partial [Enterobacterales bacterium]|nr:hypothetical protein [Enterobacterales bacterium]
MPPPHSLLILGFGGHARAVADVALAFGAKQVCFIDINARPNETFGAFPVLPSWDEGRLEGWSVMPASGDSVKRQAQCKWAAQLDWPLATIV